MKQRLLFFLYVGFLLALCSCQREHLYYGSNDTAGIRINLDWTKSQLSPNGATVAVYHEDGTLFRVFEPFNSPKSGVIELPTGRYNLIVFNNSISEFDGSIGFNGAESWKTFLAYAIPDINMSARLGGEENDPIVKEVDTLAVGTFLGLNVTSDMINYYYDRPEGNLGIAQTIELAPKRVTSMFNIKVHVKGLKYAKANTLALLSGMAGGYYLGQGDYTQWSVTHTFILNNRVYNNSSLTDGTISASILTFGKHDKENNPDAKYLLTINFILLNGEQYSVSYDVTDKMIVHEDVQVELDLDLELELPTIIGDNGSFNIDIDDWDEEEIAIPF